MHRKGLLALMLVLALCLGLCPAALGAESAGSSGWTVTELAPLGKYSSIGEFHDGLSMVSLQTDSGEKYGFIDAAGREVVPCQYFVARDFSEGLAAVKSAVGWGYINTAGQEVIACQYDWPGNFADGVAIVQMNATSDPFGGIYGVIDKAGNIVVPFGRYEFIDEEGFSGGLALVRTADGLGIVDKTGTEVVPCGKYSISFDIDKGSSWEGPVCSLIYVQNGYPNPKFGLIDTTGREIVPCKYDELHIVPHGFVVAELNGKYGILNTSGQEVVPLKYDTMYEGGIFDYDDYGGLVEVSLETGTESEPVYLYGVIDQEGTEILPCQYSSVSILNEGLILTKLDGKYSLFDTATKEWFPLKDGYSYTCGNGHEVESNFSNGLAMVAMDAIGYIDRTGREVIPCSKYYDGRAFSEGVAAVGTEVDGTVIYNNPFLSYQSPWPNCNKWGLIDTSGREVIPCKYSAVYSCHNGFVTVMIKQGTGWNRQYGLFDKYGNQVLPCEYKSIECLSDSLIRVNKDAKTQLLRATWNGDRPTPPLSGAGTLDGKLAWEIKDGALTVGGTPETGDMVVAACQDAQERFIGAAVVRAGQQSAKLPENCAAARLFWLGAGLAPKCPCAQIKTAP